ncbi:hypothetical protein L195_g041185 [Trifolium pratense]|uniref:RNase H type-1 domain-containing protein n=1 Tax=Trifolium pratense TaxID=57577 RepID=A0A2K3K753_TRIPR|nr:hypothetical protein L195_g049272 [Trifolium pratense]PNX62117.1 hypothetical protein L195_g052807 [Trifolium pratense]PNX62311.1 hypothetical protein L195_g052914 [Trifolium pratense]PNX85119.1 hypothetical protein L195_g041185 [Trifolium pratense]
MSMTMRACIRDEKDKFIAAMTANKEGAMTTSEAKAWNLNQGIHWMVSLGYNKVYLEMDCKMVVNDVNNMKPNQPVVQLLKTVEPYLVTITTFSCFH